MNESEQAETSMKGVRIDNLLPGTVAGSVVQAGTVGTVHFHGVRDESVVPSQLPAAPRYFTSRDRELHELSQQVDDDQPSLVVITGAGGVGKTALALRWLHDVRADFPDGQLYVDLGGFTQTEPPVAPEQALEWFLLALGLPSVRMPESFAQRMALFRSMTADRSISMLLDNAASAAQVRPLLPASRGSAVVVTSRQRLSGLAMDGGRFTEIEPLETDGAIDLLQRVVGPQRVRAEREFAEDLVRLCGGLPLALMLVGARLSAQPRRSLARELNEVSAARRRLDALSVDDDMSVSAVFDLSYRRLAAPVARIYRLCALHPGQRFGPQVIAAAVQLPVAEVTAALAVLVDGHLVIEIDVHRYQFHDLLRLHARQQASVRDERSTRDLAVSRMIEWYLDTTVAADLLVHPLRERLGPRYRSPRPATELFATDRDALRWLETERANLLASVLHAARYDCDEVIWQFCEALWGFFLHSRHYDDWLTIHAAGIPAARRNGGRSVEARLHSQLGFAYAKLHRYDDAIVENSVAMELAEAEHDGKGVATALSQLGRSARGKGDLAAALDYYTRSRVLQEQLGVMRGAALCRRRIGHVLTALGRHEEAISELKQSVSIMAALSDRTQHARSLMFLGSSYGKAGLWDMAGKPLTDALAMMRELESPYYQAEILVVLGEVAEGAGRRHEAREHYRQAYQYYLEVEEPEADRVRARLARLESQDSMEEPDSGKT